MKKYRLETSNLHDQCFSIQYFDTLEKAEKQGYRHTFLEYYRYNEYMQKNVRLFTIWEV